MDRRKFIVSTAAIGAAGLIGSAFAQESKAGVKGSSDIHPDLTGVWSDPYLSQPSSIIIESNKSGSKVRVTGTYWHKRHWQSTFHGTGELKGNVLTVNYSHDTIEDLGGGVVNMELVNIDNTFVLKGNANKSDGSWSAGNMNWYKERR